VVRLTGRLNFIHLPEGTNSIRFADKNSRFLSYRNLFESEQPLFSSRRSVKVGACEMGHWIQARRGVSVVQLEIALLIVGVIAAGVWLAYYASSLPR